MKFTSNISKNWMILIIMLVGGILRFYVIFHGYPYIFHPDEPATVRGGIGIRFNINPNHFDWPHLYFYANYILFTVFAFIRDFVVSIGLKELISNTFPILWNDKLIFYYLSRIMTSIIGIATAIPIYLSAKELFSKKAGLIAASTMMLVPYLVIYSKLALPDIPMVFFMCWYIYYSSKIYKDSDVKNYVLAGIFLGLSASTKYHGGLTVLYIVLVHLLKHKLDIKKTYKILIAGLFSIMSFIAGTPFILFDFKTFIRSDSPQGALWQFTNVGGVSFVQRINAFIKYFSLPSAEVMGYFILYSFVLSSLISIFLFMRNQRNKDLLKLIPLYIPTIIFIYIISGFSKNMPHYYFIAYPFMILIFSQFVDKVLEYIKPRKLKIVLLLSIFIPMFLTSLKYSNQINSIKTGTAYGGEIIEYTEIIE